MKVTFPTSKFISPGPLEIHTLEIKVEEKWFLGVLVESIEHKIENVHHVVVPEPGKGFRGTFFFADHEFKIVRDDDLEFWGGQTKQEWMKELKARNAAAIKRGADQGWWDIGPDGNPQKPALKVSIAEMAQSNKTLMAHLMVDLGFFTSVSQARKNGWDKPLELGRHELGPKKKRAFVEILP